MNPIIYANGCSYTANMVLECTQRYPELIGAKASHGYTNYETFNVATPGACNRQIIRSTMRHCMKFINDGRDVLALIQLTHLHRTEYADETIVPSYGQLSTIDKRIYDDAWHSNANLSTYFFNDEFRSIKPNQQGLPSKVDQWANLGFILHNETAAFRNLCLDIVGLTSFLKANNIKYVIYMGPKLINIDESINLDPLYQFVRQDPNILDLFEFSMLGLTGKDKHPDIDGMQLIADYFFNLLFEQE